MNVGHGWATHKWHQSMFVSRLKRKISSVTLKFDCDINPHTTAYIHTHTNTYLSSVGMISAARFPTVESLSHKPPAEKEIMCHMETLQILKNGLIGLFFFNLRKKYFTCETFYLFIYLIWFILYTHTSLGGWLILINNKPYSNIVNGGRFTAA